MKLDFRTKFFMTVVISYVAMMEQVLFRNMYLMLVILFVPYILFMLSGYIKIALKGIILTVISFILHIYMFNIQNSILLSVCLFMNTVFLSIIPGIAMGSYSVMTTDMGEVIASMTKMKFPDQLIIPISVMARFYYTILIDYGQIKDAMFLDGLSVKKLIFHPLKLFEYRVVPLLMCITRTADEVTISAITRGLEVGGKRSSIYDIKFGIVDYVLLFLTASLLIYQIGGQIA